MLSNASSHDLMTCTAKPTRHQRDFGSLFYSIEITRQNQFEREVVRRAGQTEARPGLDVEGFARIIQDGEDLMRLLVSGRKMFNGTEIGIMLQRHRPVHGYIVSDPCGGREI